MRRGVSVRAYEAAEEETANGRGGKKRASFPQKMGRKKRKEGEFRKKVHKFSFTLSLCSKNEAFFSRKIRPFETKFLLLRLIKHNFPFIPPHCGVHIAQSRGTFPDHSAQTLFDLPDEKRMIDCTSILKVRLPRVNKVPDGKAGGPTCGKAYDESRLGKVEPLVAMYPSSSQSRLFMDVRCSHSVFAVVG